MLCPTCGADDSGCACALVEPSPHVGPHWPSAPHPAPSPVDLSTAAANPADGVTRATGPTPDAGDLLQFLRDFSSAARTADEPATSSVAGGPSAYGIGPVTPAPPPPPMGP